MGMVNMSDTLGKVNPRELALDIIIEVLERGGYCNKALDDTFRRYQALTKQNRSFISRLCQGCVERCITLDYIIMKYSKVPVKKQKVLIRNVLRMTAYQLVYMNQVTDFAACSEGVKLVRKRGLSGLAGFVNAVSRSIARECASLPGIPEMMDKKQRLVIEYSMPEWIIDKWAETYSIEEIEGALTFFLEEKDTCIRCNESIALPQEQKNMLVSAGVDVRESMYNSDCFRISGYDTLFSLEGFCKGAFTVQDESSAMVARVADVKPGNVILDICAAPGGKSLHLADRLKVLESGKYSGKHGKVISCDISEQKLLKIRENVERCGFDNIELMINDAVLLNKEFTGCADIVIADLPCSGLGIIGKKPDIKYRLTPEKLDELGMLQRKMLVNAVQYLKPDGILVFSTCTVSREENEDNVEFLCRESGMETISLDDCLPGEFCDDMTAAGMLRLFPGKYDTDGFFISKLRRRKV